MHSHLHGAIHAGAGTGDVEGTLHAIADLMSAAATSRYGLLWARVKAMAVAGGTAAERMTAAPAVAAAQTESRE